MELGSYGAMCLCNLYYILGSLPKKITSIKMPSRRTTKLKTLNKLTDKYSDDWKIILSTHEICKRILQCWAKFLQNFIKLGELDISNFVFDILNLL